MVDMSVEWANMGQWPVYLGFTMSPDDFAEAVKRMDIEQDVPFLGRAGANATTHTFERRGTLTFIITLEKSTRRHSKEQVAALIAHEAMHVVQQMTRELAQGLRFDDESEAYLLQHIVQHCLQIAWDTGRVRSTVPD